MRHTKHRQLRPEFKPMFEPPRRCKVDGRPAVFHRWVDEDKVKVQINTLMHRDDAMRIMQDHHDYGFLPANASYVVLRATFALVEYADGTVDKVEPEKVKFTGRRAGE